MINVPSHWATLKRPRPARSATAGASEATPVGSAADIAKNNTNEAQGGTPQPAPAVQQATRKKARQSHEHAEPGTMRELARSISQSIVNTTPSRLDPSALMHLGTVLSGVAYREILQNLFGDGEALPAEVPVIAKAYEEAYLRECIGPNERPCVMGPECEGHFLSRTHRFTLTELLLPGETRAEPQMCVLCCRKHTQKLYFDLLYNPLGTHMGLIQRYGVVVGAPGEYAATAALIMPAHGPMHAMPFPSVAYCRADYTVLVRNTTRFVVQAKSLDFQPSSQGVQFGSAV